MKYLQRFNALGDLSRKGLQLDIIILPNFFMMSPCNFGDVLLLFLHALHFVCIFENCAIFTLLNDWF
jgi:hypothetical protein